MLSPSLSDSLKPLYMWCQSLRTKYTATKNSTNESTTTFSLNVAPSFLINPFHMETPTFHFKLTNPYEINSNTKNMYGFSQSFTILCFLIYFYNNILMFSHQHASADIFQAKMQHLLGMSKKHGVDMRSSHIHVNIILC